MPTYADYNMANDALGGIRQTILHNAMLKQQQKQQEIQNELAERMQDFREKHGDQQITSADLKTEVARQVGLAKVDAMNNATAQRGKTADANSQVRLRQIELVSKFNGDKLRAMQDAAANTNDYRAKKLLDGQEKWAVQANASGLDHWMKVGADDDQAKEIGQSVSVMDPDNLALIKAKDPASFALMMRLQKFANGDGNNPLPRKSESQVGMMQDDLRNETDPTKRAQLEAEIQKAIAPPKLPPAPMISQTETGPDGKKNDVKYPSTPENIARMRKGLPLVPGQPAGSNAPQTAAPANGPTTPPNPQTPASGPTAAPNAPSGATPEPDFDPISGNQSPPPPASTPGANVPPAAPTIAATGVSPLSQSLGAPAPLVQPTTSPTQTAHPAADQLPTPASQAEFDAYPPGTRFKNPKDGRVLVKPQKSPQPTQ
jgi:hypothetical protein